MPALNPKRAVVGGLVAVSAAAAYYVYKRKSTKAVQVKEENEGCSKVDENENLDNFHEQKATDVTTEPITVSASHSAKPKFSWSEEMDQCEVCDAANTSQFCSEYDDAGCGDAGSSGVFLTDATDFSHMAEEEVGRVMCGAATFHSQISPLGCLKDHTHMQSPSTASDLHSESSNDSGKGGSAEEAGNGMSPIEELIEVPPMYEFEIPQEIVGLLIGRKGVNVKWLMQETGTHIVIRPHFNQNDTMKICSIEGSRNGINKCLRLIRRKFPVSEFPELKLTPLLPPPITSPHTPIWDSIVQLALPVAVNCEVTLSSMVSAGHFFLQQPTHPTFPSLTRLDQYMLAVYMQPVGIPSLPRPIEAGVVCAAPVLGGWYRAMTLGFTEETDEVLVKFVDYGGYSRLPAADLKQIRSDFMTMPFQASECYLANVLPIDEVEGWSAEAATFMEQMTVGKVLEAHTLGTAEDGVSLVELFCVVDGSSVQLNSLLMEQGYAKWSS